MGSVEATMTNDLTRRQLLLLGTAGSVGGAAWYVIGHTIPEHVAYDSEPSTPVTPNESAIPDRSTYDDIDVRGAVYIPSRAFNLYQMWQQYDPAVVERDLSYARQVNLNAVRTWLCYEAWLEDPEAHEAALDHFLQAADDRGISVLIGLFDAIGIEPTPSRLTDTDPKTAIGLSSPSSIVLFNREKWDEPRGFVDWFMERYRDDDRLLGIEVMNEPGWESSKYEFAAEMFERVAAKRGSVPLTVGATSLVNNADYIDWGSDILQFHYNFASNPGMFRTMLERVSYMHDAVESPIWLTEWQRARASPKKPSEQTPKYASLAPLIHEFGYGNFFWSLMVKPAWVEPQRSYGVVNGLFHEDGAVWSMEDAHSIQAMSGTADFEGEERKRIPEWGQV